jgi:hypothetical protein
MPEYVIKAKRTHWYEVTVEADGEMDAIDQVRDWMADDWEEANLEVQAQWDFDAIKTGESK